MQMSLWKKIIKSLEAKPHLDLISEVKRRIRETKVSKYPNRDIKGMINQNICYRNRPLKICFVMEDQKPGEHIEDGN